jgi:hypothetical protein
LDELRQAQGEAEWEAARARVKYCNEYHRNLNAHELTKIARMVERRAKLIEGMWHDHFRG